MVTPHVLYDPTVAIRIVTVVMVGVTLVGVVAAGVAIGVVVGRQTAKSSPFVQSTTVLRSDISIAINRLIASYELQQFYDAPTTLRDLIASLNAKLKLYFPQSAIQIVISAFSGEPILISDLGKRKQKRQYTNRPSIVTVNGSAYFTQNYTSNEIRAAFINYTQSIILINALNGQSSSALGTFSSLYSTFTDTHPVNLTIDQASALVSISISSTANVSNVTISPSAG